MKSKYLIVGAVVAGVFIGTAVVAEALTHTLQFVETPIVQLYTSESYNATTLIVTPVPIDLDGNVLTISSFGSSPTLTVDPGISGYEEIEGFTSITNNGNGTATIGGLSRDLASQYPYTTSGTGRAHAAGSTVVFSNNPQMYARFAAPENTQTWTATQTFSSTTPPAYDFNPNFNLVSSTTFASVGYVASTSYNGTVNGTTAAKGIFQQATSLQAASSTAVGSTGANLVLGSNIATDTPSTSGCATSGGCVVMSLLNGKLSQLWYDLTQAFTVTGLWTFNTGGFIDNASSTLTSTLNANGTNTFGGATTFNSSATFSGAVAGIRTTYASTTPTLSKNNGYATSSPFMSIAAGALSASSTIDIYGDWSCAQGNTTQTTCNLYIRDSVGDTIANMSISPASTNNQTVDCAFHAQILFNSSLASQITLSQMSGGTYVNASAAATFCPTDLINTSSVNFANAQSLGFVVRGNDSNGTATLNNFSIVVTR